MLCSCHRAYDDVQTFVNVFGYGTTPKSVLPLEDIPRLIFQILAQLATLNASVSPVAWPSRISFAELHSYAQRRCLGVFQVCDARPSNFDKRRASIVRAELGAKPYTVD